MKINFLKKDEELIKAFNFFFKDNYKSDAYQNSLNKISNLNLDNFYYWISPIASRNHYQTDTYLNFLKICFLRKYFKENNKRVYQIEVDSLFLKFYLNHVFKQRIKIRLSKNYFVSVTREIFKNLLFTVKEIIVLFLLNPLSKNKIPNLSEKIIVSSYLINSIEDLERYFPMKFTKVKNKEVVFYINFLSRNPLKIKKLHLELEKRNIPFISKYYILSYKDILKEVINIIFTRINYPKTKKVTWDIYTFFKITNFQLSFFRNSLGGALNKVGAEKIAKQNTKINFFNIGENQALDKGLNFGFKKNNSNLNSYFVQSYLPRRLDNFMYPNALEIKGNVISSKVLSPFSFLENKFDDAISFQSIPAFRYSYLWNDISKQTSSKLKIISIFLPNLPDEANRIFKFTLNTIKKIKSYEWQIKLHPTGANNKKFINDINSNASLKQSFETSFDLISKSEIIITGNSGVILDCLFLKKKCLVFSDLNLFPIENLENFHNFSTWSSNEELNSLIENYDSKKKEQNKENSFQNKFELIKPSKDKMNTFLENLF